MFVSGTQVAGGPPIEQVLAHEYGHHIASHRLNPPWPARDWGPKHWANRMSVCKYTAAGLMFPGDEGDHYAQNPGEGWAQGYRKMIQGTSAGPTSAGTSSTPTSIPSRESCS